MYNLIVDIGNTFIKYALMERGELRDECRAERFSVGALTAWLGGRSAARAIVGSSRGDASAVAAALRGLGIPTLLFTPETAVPLGNDYLTPETLGRDRLAAAVGADALYPGRSVLIVDFGTAVTLDVVSGGRFRAGSSRPGCGAVSGRCTTIRRLCRHWAPATRRCRSDVRPARRCSRGFSRASATRSRGMSGACAENLTIYW